MEARTGVLFMCLLVAAGVTGRGAAKSASEPDWLINKISTKVRLAVPRQTRSIDPRYTQSVFSSETYNNRCSCR